MPKFTVTATFDLETSIGFDGYLSNHFDADSDESYWGSEEITSSGGCLKFEIEAEDEDAAEDEVRSRIDEGNEVEDDHGVTWLVANLDFEVEKHEMGESTAREVIAALFARLVAGGHVSEEETEAVNVLLKLGL